MIKPKILQAFHKYNTTAISTSGMSYGYTASYVFKGFIRSIETLGDGYKAWLIGKDLLFYENLFR